jgi:hypothetical protein
MTSLQRQPSARPRPNGAQAAPAAVRHLKALRTPARLAVLPVARGPWSERLMAALRAGPAGAIEATGLLEPTDPLADDDLQLALYLCYELHYTAIAEVDERWEWAPSLLAYRARLEEIFGAALHEIVPRPEPVAPADVGARLQDLVRSDDGPPLSRYVETQATREQVVEHVIHRSAYQLKEADPHSWAIPRLTGAAKAALLEIQFDEYGGGRPERIHAALFAKTMEGLGLDPTYGAYPGRIPGITLATVNLLSGFGLHRRSRGALVGHLAAFEMTSSIPNRRYGNGFRRLGFDARVTDFYDEHVEADAVHENIAAWDLAGSLAAAEPQLADDIVFGAAALLALEARWGRHLLDHWNAGVSSLR